METQPEITQQIKEIAKDIANKTALSLKADLPLFLIVYYDHETDKLALQESIRQSLKQKEISTRPFDPKGNQEHTAGKLYPLLASASLEKSLCIIAGLPLNKRKIEPDNAFIRYLNIFRDRIAKERIRMLLFLHSSNAEQFMNTAGDLWDFRHGTYWLERKKEESRKIQWNDLEKKFHGLKDQDREEILNHIKSVRPLIDDTEESEEKARLLVDLASWLRRRHAYSSAIEMAYQAIRHTEGQRDSLNAEIEFELGYSLSLNSDLSEALGHYKQSLEITREIGDKATEGTTLNNISQIFTARGDYDTALKYLQQSLEIRREIGDKAGEGATLNNISQIFKARGDYDTALKYLQQSLEITREIGNKAGEGTTLNNISQIFKARGDYDTALKHLQKSLEITREIGDKAGEAVTCYNLAMEWERRKNIKKAIHYLKRAVEIEEQTDHPDFVEDNEYLTKLIQKQQKDSAMGGHPS
ncbi:MAG: tetratricopeptide repeat protein [Desulfobacteraceae bacterium]|nr:tetratricopeptide repeat protein [Desulfobacteraceae bacterium]